MPSSTGQGSSMSFAKDALVRVAPPLRRLVQQREALAAENAVLRSEAGRHIDESGLSYLFIVTYGRSGSTLLQGLLNAQPGVVIRGENGGSLEFMHAMWREMDKRRSDLGKPRHAAVPTHPWFGLDGYSSQDAADSIRRHMLDVVLRPPTGTTVTGFKEIRWWRHRNLTEYLRFVSRVFPGARFVMNTRNNADVVRSKWWAERDETKALGQVADYENRMTEAAESLGDSAYTVHYDDWVADPERLRGLYDWLGEPFDRARIDEVLATRHSY